MQTLFTKSGERKLRLNKTEKDKIISVAALVKEIGYQAHDPGVADLAADLVVLANRFCTVKTPDTAPLFDKEETIAAGAEKIPAGSTAF